VLKTTSWPDTADEILLGDQAVMLAYVTPASGAVLAPLTNFGLHDREARSSSAVNSSVGMWRKLDRIRGNPSVALAYHTREHGYCDRPEYVLVQGRASLSSPHPRYVESTEAIRESFERLAGGNPRGGRLWQWWLRDWHLRVGIEIAVERVMVWPELACRGTPRVYGAPLPAEPPRPQRHPARGSSPRLDHTRAAKRAARMPHVLLGWVGADGLPMVVPVEVVGSDERGIELQAPEGVVPSGGRRAGLTAHWFGRYVIGQNQRVHTGWLEPEPADGRVVYAPHTKRGYWLPRSKLVYKLAAGFATRRGVREARRAGKLVPLQPGPR
jgi:hypothetical protein